MVGTGFTRSVAVALALASTWAAAPAKGDTATYYAAVVCEGNQALVRFARAENQDQPDSSSNESGLDTPLWRLSPQDPRRCRLSDGREVVLQQASRDDRVGHGECGADSTEVSSLWAGGGKVYSDQVWHNKCDYPSSIRAVLLRGTSLIGCRTARRWMHDPYGPPRCVDRSSSLARAPLSGVDTAGGRLLLIRAATGMDEFCKALPSRPAEQWRDGVPWQTFPQPPEQVLSLDERWSEVGENGSKTLADVFGDGRMRRLVRVEEDGGGFHASYWAVPPGAVSDADAEAPSGSFVSGRGIPEARAKGIPVVAGDITAYGETNYVWITPSSEADAFGSMPGHTGEATARRRGRAISFFARRPLAA